MGKSIPGILCLLVSHTFPRLNVIPYESHFLCYCGLVSFLPATMQISTLFQTYELITILYFPDNSYFCSQYNEQSNGVVDSRIRVYYKISGILENTKSTRNNTLSDTGISEFYHFPMKF
jgi:hypothetical protein